MSYKFYGWNTEPVHPINDEYHNIRDQRHLYDLLSALWSKSTCAPRMRDRWSEDNKTAGQCSITAFLVQDIFGGEVYGVPLGDGNYHCFNVIGDILFDLTSEQFGDIKLDYNMLYPQSRDIHFSKLEKYQRYLLLKESLLASIR